jgi:hypothetical protein
MKLDGLKKEIGVGVLSAIVIAGIGVIWNGLSGGGMIHALGGVTQADLEIIARRISVADVPAGAVMAFDRPKDCPEGWEPEDDAAGSAIVGIGAHLTGASGNPIEGGYDLGTYDKDSRQKSACNPHIRGQHPTPYVSGKEDYREPISPYLYGVKTSVQPTYLPLIYCMKSTK